MSSEILHKHHSSIFKNWHLVALLIPSIIFVFVLSTFANQAEKKDSSVSANIPTPKPFIEIIIGNEKIKAERADTEYTRKVGLSNKDYLLDNEGMLFVFPSDNVRPQFWMKDMKFSVDLLWINDGIIVQIDNDLQTETTGTPENKLKLYLPNQEIDYLIAVKSGFADSNGVFVGSAVNFNEF